MPDDETTQTEPTPSAMTQPAGSNGNGAQSSGDVLLEVRNLKTYYPVLGGVLRRRVGWVKAVDDVSFAIKRGETLGLVGESGCGKTTVGRSIIRLLKPLAGEVRFEGQDILKLPRDEMK